MELSFLESVLYGILSGLTDILPVSAPAHKILLLKLFGVGKEPAFLSLFLHLAILGGLYYSCQSQILKISRARRLARVPKRRRKRPLDTKSLMDFRLVQTMFLPTILGFLLYDKVSPLGGKLMWVAIFLLINGVILYIPQFLPGSNKDSRMLSRVEGLLIGLGGAAAIFPGISAVGAAMSIGSVCGVEKNYGFDMALFLNMAVTVGFIVFDVLALIAGGLGALSFGIIMQYLLSAAAAFEGVVLGVRMMRKLLENNGLTSFAFYCWGCGLFTFVLNLVA